MTPLLSPDRNDSKDGSGIAGLIGEFAKGAIVLLLFLGAWWRLNQLYIRVDRYFYAVIALLSLMAVCSVGIVVERFFKYRYARHQSRRFAEQVDVALRTCEFNQAIEIAGRHAESPRARVVKAGLTSFRTNMPLLGDVELIDMAERAMRRAASSAHLELKRGFTLLACVANTAPLVGVFGTIVGIIAFPFPGYDGPKSGWIAVVAEGISVALMPTALSLSVALPVQWCWEHFRNELEAFDLEMGSQSAKVRNCLTVCLEQER